MDYELSDLTCRITQELFEDPVIAMDGFTYERYAIEAHFQKTVGHVKSSPITRAILPNAQLIPNTALKNYITELKRKKQIPLDDHSATAQQVAEKPASSNSTIETRIAEPIETQDWWQEKKQTWATAVETNKTATLLTKAKTFASKQLTLRSGTASAQDILHLFARGAALDDPRVFERFVYANNIEVVQYILLLRKLENDRILEAAIPTNITDSTIEKLGDHAGKMIDLLLDAEITPESWSRTLELAIKKENIDGLKSILNHSTIKLNLSHIKIAIYGKHFSILKTMLILAKDIIYPYLDILFFHIYHGKIDLLSWFIETFKYTPDSIYISMTLPELSLTREENKEELIRKLLLTASGTKNTESQELVLKEVLSLFEKKLESLQKSLKEESIYYQSIKKDYKKILTQLNDILDNFEKIFRFIFCCPQKDMGFFLKILFYLTLFLTMVAFLAGLSKYAICDKTETYTNASCKDTLLLSHQNTTSLTESIQQTCGILFNCYYQLTDTLNNDSEYSYNGEESVISDNDAYTSCINRCQRVSIGYMISPVFCVLIAAYHLLKRKCQNEADQKNQNLLQLSNSMHRKEELQKEIGLHTTRFFSFVTMCEKRHIRISEEIQRPYLQLLSSETRSDHLL